ncbi:MAG: hypothetical protein IPG99_11645 [Ignavibacteria bacterium]|nr:hypothetical protein [Ignavibacteria bacterium]
MDYACAVFDDAANKYSIYLESKVAHTSGNYSGSPLRIGDSLLIGDVTLAASDGLMDEIRSLELRFDL